MTTFFCVGTDDFEGGFTVNAASEGLIARNEGVVRIWLIALPVSIAGSIRGEGGMLRCLVIVAELLLQEAGNQRTVRL